MILSMLMSFILVIVLYVVFVSGSESVQGFFLYSLCICCVAVKDPVIKTGGLGFRETD